MMKMMENERRKIIEGAALAAATVALALCRLVIVAVLLTRSCVAMTTTP